MKNLLTFIIECTYIGNIVDILLCGNLHYYYCMLPYIYIYRKGWLTIRLSLLIILNLVSEPSAVRTPFSLPPFAAGPLSLFPPWILQLPPTSLFPPVVQHSRPAIPKLLLVVSSLPNSSLHLQSMSLILLHKSLPFLCLSWEHTLQLSFLYQTPTKLFR